MMEQGWNQMRLFVAIQLTPEMKQALCAMQDQMRAQRIAGHYTESENLHLTLAFIGDYPNPDDVPLPMGEPFPMALGGFGAFGALWWAGIQPSEPLNRCVDTLRRALAHQGVPFDRKRFSPHITLVRRAVGQPVVEVPEVGMMVDRISLMRSVRGKHGMIYTELRSSADS